MSNTPRNAPMKADPSDRKALDCEAAGCDIPYYPEMKTLDSSFSVGINEHNYIGEKSEQPKGNAKNISVDSLLGRK